jgi:hypothetical protein
MACEIHSGITVNNPSQVCRAHEIPVHVQKYRTIDGRELQNKNTLEQEVRKRYEGGENALEQELRKR